MPEGKFIRCIGKLFHSLVFMLSVTAAIILYRISICIVKQLYNGFQNLFRNTKLSANAII